MTLEAILAAITQVGFPIVCVVVMGWFIYKIYQNTTEQNISNMAQVQERCRVREEKLYSYLDKAQEINSQAITTLARYDEKLNVIQEDLEVIKEKVLGND